MKTKHDPRHLKRIKVIQELFAQSFYENNDLTLSQKSSEIIRNRSKIDALIEKSAPAFPIAKIAKIDVAILRLAIFELLYEKKEPVRVVIDEAVELGKEFGGDASASFINGVLGNILKNVQ